jgi:Outer membrane protein beta-barrel domain
MLYKSSILTITLLLCSIGNAIAAEPPVTLDFDGDQQLRTTGFANASDPIGETLDSLPIDVPTQIAVNPDVLPVQVDPLVAKAMERRDPEALTLPIDIERAWSLDINAAPVAGVKLQTHAPADGVVGVIDPATTPAELSPAPVAATFDPAQYLDLGYYSPTNSLLDGRIAQAPETTPPVKPEPQQPIAPPVSSSVERRADKKNYVGVTVGSFLNIPVYGIGAKFGIADNISVRPFIQFGKVPQSLLNLADANNNVSISGFIYGLSATYDFNIPSSDLAPYAGIGLANASGSYVNNNPNTFQGGSSFTSPVYVELGADYSLTNDVTINVNYKFQDLGFFSFGAGYKF